MNFPKITLPTVAGMRSGIEQAVTSLKEYSVDFKLPNCRSVTVTSQTQIDPAASRVQKLFEGSALKGFSAALTTVFVGVVVLGGLAALTNPVGLGVLALAVALFVAGSTLNVSHTPPAPAAPVAPVVVPPTRFEWLASYVGF